MTTLEFATVAGLMILVALEPVRHVRGWWARTRPFASVDEHQAFLDALGEVVG